MEKQVYHDMIKGQENHWWFKARRKILNSILKKYIPSGKIKIFEIGCGTGGNFPMLKKFGDVFAMEMNEFASKYAAAATGLDVRIGWLPDNIPFNEKFDVICMFDVLEHIKDDKSALQEIQKLLNPGGIVILTVPAHQWLYGSHDRMHYHHRRYSTKVLKKIIFNFNMKILRLSHFNFLLFPLIILARLIDIMMKPEESTGYSIPNTILNKLLYTIFSLEKYLINRITFPFGASIFAILKSSQ